MVRYKFLIALSIFLISCAPSKKISTNFNAELALLKIAARNRYIETINAEGTITIDSPGFSNSANLKISLKRPDTLSLQVEAIFGINLGEVKIYGDRFEVIDRFNDRVMRGRVDDYMQSYLGFKIPVNEIIDVLIASPHVDETVEVDGGEFVSVIKRNDYEIVLRFGPDLELESCEFVRDNGEIFVVKYSRYAKFGTVTLPRVVKILDGKRRNIYLSFSEMKINGGDEKR